MRVVTIHPELPREDRLQDAVGALVAGQIVALPTETFYGLAVDALDRSALRRLNHAKRRPSGEPILLLIADLAQVRAVAAAPPPRFDDLARAFWPGPLTLVVPAAERVPPEVTGGRGSVAVRVPGLALPRRLARALGRPISGVSANLHGRDPCRTAGEVVEALGDRIEIVLDGGPAPGGAPSTIVDLTGARPKLLREGVLPPSALAPFLPDLERP